MEFSIIIPVYNVPVDNLRECISSIKAQSFSSYEILLVDDGSTDPDLKDYLKELSLDNNISVFRQQNAGSAKARNTGLKKAIGKNILFVDADDRLENDFYKKSKKQFKEEYDVLFFNYSFWNEKEQKYYRLSEKYNLSLRKDEIYANIMFYPETFNNYFFGSIWGKCFSRSFLERNGIFFEPELRKAQDRRFMMDVINKASNMKYFNVDMYMYRKTDQSITHAINWKMEDYYLKLKDSFDSFCKNNQVSEYSKKFLNYGIFNELTQLTVFHIDNKMSRKQRNSIAKRMFDEFDLKESIKKIKYSDVRTKKGKIKLFLIKHNLFSTLNYFFNKKQANERRIMFEERGKR